MCRIENAPIRDRKKNRKERKREREENEWRITCKKEETTNVTSVVKKKRDNLLLA